MREQERSSEQRTVGNRISMLEARQWRRWNRTLGPCTVGPKQVERLFVYLIRLMSCKLFRIMTTHSSGIFNPQLQTKILRL